jgi:hypothetical protein
LLLPISIYYFIKGQDIYESTQENPRFVCWCNSAEPAQELSQHTYNKLI